jgi:hypothetical protein
MLTPMLVQYVVGLCCLHRNPTAVEVTVGDLILDAAAGKRRDVDITVAVNEHDGAVRAFKAYEVKREGEPLDVATVEQLCLKLGDMPAVTHRAIVSASGFTDGAIAKAGAHNVELFVLKPWTKPLALDFRAFQGAGRPEDFLRQFTSTLLVWEDWRLHLHVPAGPRSFCYENSAPILSGDGGVHQQFASLAAFTDALLVRSTGILLELEPAVSVARTFPLELMADNADFEVSPAWPHTHTLGVPEDQVFLKLGTGLALVTSVTICGRLQWQRRKRVPVFHVLERVPSGVVFAGAAVADWGTPDGRMFAMIFSPEAPTAGIHTIRLEERHKNAIRQLKLRPPA